jgi:hypothetical protein
MSDKLQVAADALTKDQLQDELGFLFIHAPKTAGRSVMEALGVKPIINHSKIIDYEKSLGMDELIRRVKYGSVRNPWDRVSSWYLFFNIGLKCGTVSGKKNMKFSEWVVEMNNLKTYWGHPLDNLSYFRNSKGDVMVDNILRFENIDEDYQNLVGSMEVLGKTDMPVEMPKIGMGADAMLQKRIDAGFKMPATYQEMYDTQESIDIVANLNRELIKQFGYQF